MLDIKFVRNNIELVKKSLINRNHDTKILDELIVLDEKRRDILKEVEELIAITSKMMLNKKNNRI
mgnify:CR=1 FL=1